MIYADASNAAARALRSNEVGRRLTEAPNDPRAALARDYAFGPHIDRRRGDYEYHVVVRLGNASNGFETRVIVRSRTRLTGAEVGAQAENTVATMATSPSAYAQDFKRVGNNPPSQWWIVGAAYNPG